MTVDALFEKILLIEDDSSHALLIRRALRDFTADVEHIGTFTMARNYLQSNHVDLIITDLQLPDSSDGRHMRELVNLVPDVPVIVLTSSNSLHNAVEAMKLGARDYIVKNFDQDFREVMIFSLSRVHAAQALEEEKMRLEREMKSLRLAIENSNDGLAVANKDGHITYANRSFQAFVRLCGGSNHGLQQLLGEGVSGSDSVRESIERNFKELPTGAFWHTEITLLGGREAAFDLSLSIIETFKQNSPASVRECVVWVRDIREQKRREKFQREILSTTTHDLKGPLGAIIISAEMLSGMFQEPNRASELVLRIDSAAQSAVNLIDEFLSARRIQEGAFILKPTQQDLVALVRNVLQDYKTIAAARGITLEFECEAEGVMGNVDRLGFSRVLGNLLSNALKFTSRGGQIRVAVSCAVDEIILRVEDSGCGMEPSEVQGIFEKFSRLGRHQGTAGSGIGLFVVKSIVNAHGGKIEVTSKIQQGTAFQISFPLSPPVNDRGELISLDFA